MMQFGASLILLKIITLFYSYRNHSRRESQPSDFL